jgi:hypothetical protein
MGTKQNNRLMLSFGLCYHFRSGPKWHIKRLQLYIHEKNSITRDYVEKTGEKSLGGKIDLSDCKTYVLQFWIVILSVPSLVSYCTMFFKCLSSEVIDF